jgi:hypothetical protein
MLGMKILFVALVCVVVDGFAIGGPSRIASVRVLMSSPPDECMVEAENAAEQAACRGEAPPADAVQSDSGSASVRTPV